MWFSVISYITAGRHTIALDVQEVAYSFTREWVEVMLATGNLDHSSPHRTLSHTQSLPRQSSHAATSRQLSQPATSVHRQNSSQSLTLPPNMGEQTTSRFI